MAHSEPPEGGFDDGSFRDPSSRVFHADGEVGRLLSDDGLSDWRALRASRLFEDWTAAGRLIGTREVTGSDGSPQLRHDVVPFWSYPYEWTFAMLRDAAALQLDLLDGALAEGLTLKDATPYNVQFVGSQPVFIDIGSFRPLEEGEPWLGYRQFCQLFLFPLLVRAHADIPFQPLLRGSLDGIGPDVAAAMLRGRRFRAGVLADVVLQARADRTAHNRDVRTELGEAGFSADMIRTNIARLRKVLTKLDWQPAASVWSAYADCGHVADQRAAKSDFVRRIASSRHRRLGWDLGANDGHFSRIVAEAADTVVAIDGDELVVDRLYRTLRETGDRRVLPLVFDLADPSPGLGWLGRERRPLEARGTPDLVLMLAVMHHLVVAANLPLATVVDWAAALESEVIFEWVPPDDPMVRELTANKRPREIHADYTEAALRSLLANRFEVAEEQPVGGRILFHLVPKT